MSDSRVELRRFLERNGPGKVTGIADLAHLLAPVWPDLAGSREQAMESWKLNRMEDPVWRPPILSFRMERHGAIVGGGSTRAEIQTWMVDLERGYADIGSSTWRQVTKAAPRLNVVPIVAEVVQEVKAGTDDPRLKWSPDRSVVTIRVNEIVGPGFAQTVAGRRRRFAERLLPAMADIGWVPDPRKYHTYHRRDDDDG